MSGVFNVTSGNYTVGQVGDFVKQQVEMKTDINIKLNIKHIQDFRNYKVNIEKAKTLLGFQPQFSIVETIDYLFKHYNEISDFENDNYYNINIFKKLLNFHL